MTYAEFRKKYPLATITHGDIYELMRDGFVAIAAGDGTVFTLRIEVAQSEAGEFDFSKASTRFPPVK